MTVRPDLGDGTYRHDAAGPATCHRYLLPAVLHELQAICATNGNARQLMDLGCGSGYVADWLCARGFQVTGVEPSVSGVTHARAAYPDLDIHSGSAYEDLAGRFGRFPTVISLEVVEHLFDPRRFARNLFELLEPRGYAIISTPYHGYLKNLAIALVDASDKHFAPLWDGGHIKFWSVRTLSALMAEAGFEVVRFRRVGRIPPLANSMIAVLRKPRQ